MHKIAFIIPYLDYFESVGFPQSYDYRCDFSVMASRWYHAGVSGNVSMCSQYPDQDDNKTHLVYNYFFLSHPVWGQCIRPPKKQDNIIVFSECSDYWSKDPSIKNISSKISIEYNPTTTNYLKDFSINKNYVNNLVNVFNDKKRFTVPLGTSHELCKKEFNKEKVLLLDEPHKVVLDNLSDKSKQHVFSYEKSLEICKILSNRGWHIKTFCTRDHQGKFKKIKNKHSWIEIIRFDDLWVPYLEMLNCYKSCFMFFSHYQETHGFSIYENLQMGNGLIVFEENFNPLTIRQFQNGIKLSLYMNNEICADLVEEYYSALDKNRSNNIADESKELFSSDTFAKRIRWSLNNLNEANVFI